MAAKTRYVKSVRDLIDAYHQFKSNPEVCYDINVWPPETWDWYDFRAWFMGCLNAKINRDDKRAGRCFTDEYQRALVHDRRVIHDARVNRICHAGRNNLRTLEMKRLYPEIDNPVLD